MTPQGIEADTAKTEGLGAKRDSPCPVGDAPDHPTIDDWQNRAERAEAECKELRADLTEHRAALLVTRACLQIAKGQFDDPDAFKALNHAIDQASTALRS